MYIYRERESNSNSNSNSNSRYRCNLQAPPATPRAAREAPGSQPATPRSDSILKKEECSINIQNININVCRICSINRNMMYKYDAEVPRGDAEVRNPKP